MTLSMELPENENVQLNEQNFRHVCRLCLQSDEVFINVFEGIEQNPSKRPLADRVYDLYQIKLLKDDGLPTNICHRCLYLSELFSEFRDGVHQCERKLQDFVVSMASRSNDDVTPTWHLDDILHDQHRSSEFQQNDVVIIDPLKCYVSSDEDSDDETTTENPQPAEINKEFPVPLPHYPMTVPDSNRSFLSDTSVIFDPKPLRNVCFCKYCEAAFAQRHECDAHEKSSHDPLVPHICRFCAFSCDEQVNLIAHIRQFHDAERPYFCTQCNKNFGRRADLRKHAVSHTNIRPFSCPVCAKAFSRKTNVTNHMKTHEDKKNSSNDSVRTQKTPIKSKTMANTEYQPMFIDQQPYPSYTNQSYQIQQISPTKQENAIYSKCNVRSEPNTIPKLKLKLTKPFQMSPSTPTSSRHNCTTCKKSFKTKRDLDRHSQIHNGTKFQCSHCQKGFARRDKLVRHEKIHTNRNKTAALPESAFLVENLKRNSHFTSTEQKSSPSTLIEKLTSKPDDFRPKFYAEYDLSETNN
ncbi:zinc finger protein 1 homolog [Contarinia nasturtii]|uniref:zinc finger protein 1 homolog n=1 Tax=Contarinia nasturtii TaxID=265458 RepID=UPI0012D44790|nr:zinc finger protein 1 homolog [Contarinia nasturtii]